MHRNNKQNISCINFNRGGLTSSGGLTTVPSTSFNKLCCTPSPVHL